MKIFTKIGLSVTNSITIYVDNNRFIFNSTNDKNHCQANHINIKFYFVKEHMKKGKIMFTYILSLDNLANLFTKPLPHKTIKRLASAMDLNPKVKDMLVQGECWNRLFSLYLYSHRGRAPLVSSFHNSQLTAKCIYQTLLLLCLTCQSTLLTTETYCVKVWNI